MTLNETRVCWASKLDDEILWYIFRFNSYPTIFSVENAPRNIFWVEATIGPLSVPPLVTNHRTTQVCRQWRRVMLNAPSIWANSIELKYLNQHGDDWRREVLIRTGEAPLTVIGRVGGDPHGESESLTHNLCTIPFVLDLLEAHWERIQTLIIESNSAAIDEKLCNLWSRPAPNLIEFVVVFQGSHDLKSAIPFTNHAPNLRTLRTDGLLFNFSEPSWSSKVRQLDLTWSKEEISIPNLLRCLESMTSLEVLRLCDIDANMDAVQPTDTAIPGPTIQLLALRSFTMQDSESLVPALLPRIIIPPQCTFSVDATTIDFSFDGEVCQRIVSAYKTFLKNNFGRSVLTYVTYSLQYTHSRDSVDVLDDWPLDMHSLEISFGSGTKSGQPRFQYFANLEDSIIYPALEILEALSVCDLGNVTTLSLSLNLNQPEIINEISELWRTLYDFLTSFESVKTLHTDEETIQFYLDSMHHCTDYGCFPQLDTVYTDLWDTGIKEFLLERHLAADPSENSGIAPIKQILFKKDSPVARDDSTDIGRAAMMGLRFGREVDDD